MGKQRLGMGGKPETDIDDQKKTRLDLSVPQVAGSALAAVAAAVLASTLGVYGTMIGAGVVSVVATCGGTIFQHLFRRTGEQIREVTVQVKPKGRQVPVRDPHDPHDPHDPQSFDDATRVMRTVSLPSDIAGEPDRTQLLWKADLPDETAEEFTGGTTHGTRVRGWKRSMIAAVVVFVVAMGGITAYEVISGGDLSGGKGTTLSNAVQGRGQKKDPPSDAPSDTPDAGSPSPDSGSDGEPTPDRNTGTGGTDSSPDPTPTPSGSSDPSKPTTPTPTPTPTPSGSTGGDTDDSDKGTAGAEDNGSGTGNGSERDTQNNTTPAP